MAYQVLARKWRPQRFEEVVGQEIVTATLQNAIKAERVAHAFLFSGVRGVGKTTTARLLAKALNCADGPTPEPCGSCPACSEIAASNAVDVLEIDAASNTGVDNIRELRESARYGTARDRFKIFIIDEVHMLSNAAFNALLKILEEPPPHVKFILATTEYHKIPVTITSRCQQFDFRPIPLSAILQRLELITQKEGMEVQESVLLGIAQNAEGSMRDAQSALDQLMAFGSQELSETEIQSLLGLIDDRFIASSVDAIAKSDGAALLRLMSQLEEVGTDVSSFCNRLIEQVRNLLVFKSSGWQAELFNVTDSQKKEIERQADFFSELDLIRFYDTLNRAAGDLRWHSRPLVHLEITLMKLIELGKLPRLESVIEEFLSSPTESSGPSTTQAVKKVVSSKPTTAKVSENGAEVSPDEGRDGDPPSPGAEVVETGASGLREQLFEAAKSEGPRLYHALQNASSIELKDEVLEVSFAESQAFHARVTGEAENLNRLKAYCARISKEPKDVLIRLVTASELGAGVDTIDDPRVQEFIQKFPGKIIVEAKGED